jgi:hypothetical protein
MEEIKNTKICELKNNFYNKKKGWLHKREIDTIILKICLMVKISLFNINN